MLKVYANIRNPFFAGDKVDPFGRVVEYEKQVSKNKTFEFQISHYAYYVFEIRVDLNWRGSDHAGPEFEFALFGWSVALKLYDHRHWDYKTRTWEVYTKEEEMPHV